MKNVDEEMEIEAKLSAGNRITGALRHILTKNTSFDDGPIPLVTIFREVQIP